MDFTFGNTHQMIMAFDGGEIINIETNKFLVQHFAVCRSTYWNLLIRPAG